MTVYLPAGCTSYRCDFQFKKTRYLGSTEQTTEKAAKAFEDALRDRLKREHGQAALDRAAGITPPVESPRFSDWAAVYRAHVDKLVEQGRLTRPERIHDLLRVVLRFFGRRPSGKDPKNPPIDGEPYHDLRLTDAIATPQWIARLRGLDERARRRRPDEKPIPVDAHVCPRERELRLASHAKVVHRSAKREGGPPFRKLHSRAVKPALSGPR